MNPLISVAPVTAAKLVRDLRNKGLNMCLGFQEQILSRGGLHR